MKNKEIALLLVITVSLRWQFTWAADCSKPVDPPLKHGQRVACRIVDDEEISTFECDYGYEFKAGVSRRDVETEDGVVSIFLTCSPIGCKEADMPLKVSSQYNLAVSSSKCVPAILPSHCLPDESYVEYACLPGYSLDEDSGVLSVKCLNSYLWDSVPMCVESEYDIEYYTDEDYNQEDTTTISTSSVPTISGLSCRNVFPEPNNSDDSKRQPKVKKDPTAKDMYLPGSYIIFQCMPGYVSPPNVTLNTTCQPNGEWSSPENCFDPSTTTEIITTLAPSLTTLRVLNTTVVISTNTTLPAPTTTTNSTVTNSTTISSLTSINVNTTLIPPLTNASTTSLPSKPDYTPCSNRFNLPSYYNETNIEFNVTLETSNSPMYKPGSSIRYTCRFGYFVVTRLTVGFNLSNTLTTVCLSNGTWSSLTGNCELHPCWTRTPMRPLNGQREVGLVMSWTGARGTHVNFTCNPFFDLIGKNRVYCSDNKGWETEMPVCQMTPNLCSIKPPSDSKGTSAPKSALRVQFKVETSLQASFNMSTYTQGMYVCTQNRKFLNQTNVGYRAFNNENLAYKNVSCIGPERWEQIPTCV